MDKFGNCFYSKWTTKRKLYLRLYCRLLYSETACVFNLYSRSSGDILCPAEMSEREILINRYHIKLYWKRERPFKIPLRNDQNLCHGMFSYLYAYRYDIFRGPSFIAHLILTQKSITHALVRNIYKKIFSYTFYCSAFSRIKYLRLIVRILF